MIPVWHRDREWGGEDGGLSPHLPRDTQFPDCHGYGGVGWDGQLFLSNSPINICHLIFLFCLFEAEEKEGIDTNTEMFLEYSSRASQPLKTSEQGLEPSIPLPNSPLFNRSQVNPAPPATHEPRSHHTPWLGIVIPLASPPTLLEISLQEEIIL